jgi:hypothetical protein
MVDHRPRSSNPTRASASSLCLLTLRAVACSFLLSTIAFAQSPLLADAAAQEPSKDQLEAKKKAADQTPVEIPADLEMQTMKFQRAAEPNLNEMVAELTQRFRLCVLSELRFLLAACGQKDEHGKYGKRECRATHDNDPGSRAHESTAASLS